MKIKYSKLLLIIITVCFSAYLCFIGYNYSYLFETISIGTAKLKVEYATNEVQWEKGLSYRKTLPQNNGMLFIFPYSEQRTFWMKNTLIPLDIIWVANKKVIGIDRMFPELGIPTSQLKRYQSPVPVDVVIETNLDWTKNNNIKIGDSVNF